MAIVRIERESGSPRVASNGAALPETILVKRRRGSLTTLRAAKCGGLPAEIGWSCSSRSAGDGQQKPSARCNEEQGAWFGYGDCTQLR